MRQEDSSLREFAVLVSEKGVVALTDPLAVAVYDMLLEGDKRPGDIADALQIPSSSLHFVMDKMLESGIIVRSKPNPNGKEVYYSVLAPRVLGSAPVAPGAVEASEEIVMGCGTACTGLAGVANMLESYFAAIGLDHSRIRSWYARDLADALRDEVGEGPIESVMQAIKDRVASLAGCKISVFSLSPPVLIFEGDRYMASKMDMLSQLVLHMMENATGKSMAVASVEDFSNEEGHRFKVGYERRDREPEPYYNQTLPQVAEPERFMVLEIDGAVSLLVNDIQTKLVDAIYERPLCVTDVVNAVNMSRSTVTTNLLRMVEDGVASVFYSESGAVYYGLNCSILMKRARRASRDAEPTREAVRRTLAEGSFAEGYMTYMLACLQELGFETDYMMVVLGARYMRIAGAEGPRNFDSLFGRMSDIARVVGLSLSVASVYPLTIGISRAGESPASAPAVTFAKGMAHQGLEMASSGIFVRVSEDTPEDSRVSFKEIYPSLSLSPTAAAEAEALADPTPSRKRTSSVRDALRNRNAKSGKPVKTVRNITGIAAVVVAAAILVLAIGAGGTDNTASGDVCVLDADPGITLYDVDGAEIALPYTGEAGSVLTFTVESSAEGVGTVSGGVASPLSGEDGVYTVTLDGDLSVVELRLLDLDVAYASVYDFGSAVPVSYAYSFDGYYPAESYAELAGGMWVSSAAYVAVEAPAGSYVSVSGQGTSYLGSVCVPAWDYAGEHVEALPDGCVSVSFEGMAFEVGGYYVEDGMMAQASEVVSMEFVTTDGPVVVTVTIGSLSDDIPLQSSGRTVSFVASGDASLSYRPVGIQR